MAIELNNFIKEILAAPSFGWVGAINNSNQPVMTRIFGFKYDDPLITLTVYTFIKDAQRLTDQISIGAKISVTVTNTQNYHTIQFKGSYQSHYDVLEEEMHYARDCNIKQTEIMESFGVPSEIFTKWKYVPSLAIVMKVDEIFDQTPKVNTGNKII